MNRRPLLLLMVPPQNEVDPDALRELRRALSDEYGAELWVRPLDLPTAIPWLRLIGGWNGRSVQEVHTSLLPYIEASFYTLDWIEESA